MAEFFSSFSAWISSTQVLEQISAVDVKNLFRNSYFLVPFISLLIYYLYKQAFNKLAIMAICIGLWYFTGTSYVTEAVVDGELNMGKVLPLVGIGGVGVGSLVYLLIIRGD